MIGYSGIDRKIRRCGKYPHSRMMTTVVDYREININKEDKYGYEQEG